MIHLLSVLSFNAFASMPFTHSANDIAAILSHRDVWQTYHGPIQKIELVGSTEDTVTYRVTVKNSEPILEPRQVVAGQRLGDPDFHPSVAEPVTIMARVGSRVVERVFDATISFADSDPLKSGRAHDVVSVVDVSPDSCAPKFGATEPKSE